MLTKDPDWSALPADTPAAVRRLLRRCLVKDRSNRLPDIGSARLDLDEAVTEPPLATVDMAGPKATRTVVWAIGAVVSVAALAALAALVAWMAMRDQPAGRSVARVLIGVTPAERLLSDSKLDASVGRGRPSRTAMVFSPDGRSLVFSAERDGRVQLYLRRLDQLDAAPIAGTDGASNPFFSPDGQSLGFHADGSLRKVPLAGGPVVVLCDVDFVYGASWGGSNQIVFARQSGGLWQVPAAGGTPIAATSLQNDAGEISHRLPQFLPDGHTVLFTVTKTVFPSWDDTQIAAQSLATGKRKLLVEGGADARFVAPGHLVYLRRGTLMAVPFDVQRLEVTTGAAVGVVADVMQAASIQPIQIDTGAGQFAVSESGSLVYVTGGVFPQDRWSLAWVDRTGRAEGLHVAPGAYMAPRLSPDGKRVAFASTSVDWDLWTYDVPRGIVARLPMEGDQSIPLWTPDGSRLTFSSTVKGTYSVLSINADGSGTAAKLATGNALIWPTAWTPGGSALLALSLDGRNQLVPRDGKTAPHPLPLSSFAAADFSPDGRWLAYESRTNRNVPGQVYVQTVPGARPSGASLEREWERAGVAPGRTRAVLRGRRLGRRSAQDSDDGRTDHDDPDLFGRRTPDAIRGLLQGRRPLS